MKFNIRLLYLYLFSFIGLLIAVVGTVRLVQLGLKVYVFGGADQYNTYVGPVTPAEKGMDPEMFDLAEQKRINDAENKRQRQREVAEASAMVLVGLPLYLYHWKTIQKEAKKYKSS